MDNSVIMKTCLPCWWNGLPDANRNAQFREVATMQAKTQGADKVVRDRTQTQRSI